MSISLLSSNNIDRDRLQKLLIDRKWNEADKETYQLMLQALGKPENHLLNSRSIKIFPCEDLRILNDLWLQHSSHRFGFSVQNEIWHNLFMSENVRDDFVANKYSGVQSRFATEVGWKKENKIMMRPKTKPDVRDIASIPRGYYPCRILMGSRSWACQLIDWNIFFERLDCCFKPTN